MRAKVALYKDPNYAAAASESAMSDDDEDYPQVPVEELVDQMTQLELEAQSEDDDQDMEVERGQIV